MKKVVIAGSACTALALVPAVLLLLLVTVLAVPAAVGACSNGPNLRLGPVPSALRARTSDGVEVTLDRQQLEHAATVVAVASRTPGAGPRAARVALMAALTESRLRMLANSRVPGSAERPNDGIGSDHDSLGLFQMRPSTGWGTGTRLMDATYQARAFLGGPTGPNRGSPAGLLDLRDWTALTDAQAAQAVEVSAYPDRYAAWAPIADRIIAALTVRSTTDEDDPEERSLVVFPLPSRSWTLTSRFGPRVDPVTGSPGFHHGTDFAAPTGTPIRSATDGRVLSAGMIAGTGTITVLSTVDGRPTEIVYLHMPADGIDVHQGQVVRAGQLIGEVGSTGHSTGPHLHFQVQPGGTTASAVDSLSWLRAHRATSGTAAPDAQSSACR